MPVFKKLLGIDRMETMIESMVEQQSRLEKENRDLAAKNESLKDEISKLERSPKDIANEKGEPWVAVIETGFEDKSNPGTGYFEIDWNSHFIKQLVDSGYSGRTDEEIVDMWFNDLCHGVINQDSD